jgi:hypothetical protein
MPDFPTLSSLALIAFRAFFRSFVKYGTRPHFKASRWRTPSRARQTTGASLVGVIFQVRSRFGKGFTVPENRAKASGGRKLA